MVSMRRNAPDPIAVAEGTKSNALSGTSFHKQSGQISINSKPELRGFGENSPTFNHQFGVTQILRLLQYIFPETMVDLSQDDGSKLQGPPSPHHRLDSNLTFR